MSALVTKAEMAMWELADKLKADFKIVTYSANVQSEHVPNHPNNVCGPVKDGEYAIYLGIMVDKNDERVGNLPLTMDLGDDVTMPVCYYFVKTAPSPY